MSAIIKILVSQSTDPWFNLATEDWLFQEMGELDHLLFLWRNRETVVIGRSQNPWLECHLEKMQQDRVQLARRQSGGGAVFHDLGNVNFTFLSRKPRYSKHDNFDIILNALEHFNIAAEVSGRNDIVVQDQQGLLRKISGNAFKEKSDRAFHHGTLLVNTDLMKLQNYLNPNKKKLHAKGAKSVKSRVTNLIEFYPQITFDTLSLAIIDEFRKFHQQNAAKLPVDVLKVENLNQVAGLKGYYNKMQDWDWLFGQTLHFTHRFEERLSWACLDVQLEVDAGVIRDARVYSDSLYPEFIESIQESLHGIKYHPAVISSQLTVVRMQFPELHKELQEFEGWLLTAFV